jgi:DNA-binding Xre family transcriptional regulator
MPNQEPFLRSHLRVRMAERGIRSIKALADMIGVKDTSTLQKIADGSCLRYPTWLIPKLCVALNCEVGDLISVVK